MQFIFSEDQRRFQESVRSFLDKECTAARIRELWNSKTGRSAELWTKLAEIGVLGILVPEEHGGLGMDEVDLVLPLEETGRAALPAPVVETAAVGAPLLAELGAAELAAEWLPRVAAGEAVLAVGHAVNPLVSEAHVADLFLLQHGDEIHALPRSQAVLEVQPCSDPSRKLFRVAWTPSAQTRVAAGADGRRLAGAALDRAALATAAQQLGIAQRLVDMAVRYATERHQFGKPIGSFQAIKHMLANVQVRVEFARPVVYRAAFCVARDAPNRSVAVSHAKIAASEAAVLAAKTALQVHGAIGYTWECDAQIWMKRAWALDAAWGTGAWHRARVAQAVLDSEGDSLSFGFSPRP